MKEFGVTPADVVAAMDEDPEGLLESLLKTVHVDRRTAERIISRMPAKHLNFAIFVAHALYLRNPSGLYKGKLIVPERDEVVRGEKLTLEGFREMLKALELYLIDWSAY